jgi:hypothetical protein
MRSRLAVQPPLPRTFRRKTARFLGPSGQSEAK